MIGLSQVDPGSLWWFERAACREEETQKFFSSETFGESKKICAECPVKSICLWWCMLGEPAGQRFGVFGGQTPRERDRIGDSGISPAIATDYYYDEVDLLAQEDAERRSTESSPRENPASANAAP